MTPVRLTPTEERVARCVSVGMDYELIARRLGMSDKTASVHVINIAGKLPNPDDLKPYTLVLLWSAHRRWLEEHHLSDSAA